MARPVTTYLARVRYAPSPNNGLSSAGGKVRMPIHKYRRMPCRRRCGRARCRVSSVSASGSARGFSDQQHVHRCWWARWIPLDATAAADAASSEVGFATGKARCRRRFLHRGADRNTPARAFKLRRLIALFTGARIETPRTRVVAGGRRSLPSRGADRNELEAAQFGMLCEKERWVNTRSHAEGYWLCGTYNNLFDAFPATAPIAAARGHLARSAC